MLNWSNNPGCFERHLQRKATFPFLFPADDNLVSQEDVDSARERDSDDLAKLQSDVSDFLSKLGERFTMEESKALFDRIAELRQRAAQIGGEALSVVEAMRGAKEALLSQMGKVFSQAGEEDAREALTTWSALDEVQHHPFLAECNRPDSPIKQGEEIAALLTEDSETIYEIMKLFEVNPKWIKQYQEGALSLAKKALADGYTIPDLKARLSEFGVSRLQVLLLLATAKSKSLLTVPSSSPNLKVTSSLIAALMFLRGLMIVSTHFIQALSMITGGVVVLVMLRYLKTNLQDFTAQEFRSVREHFPEEIGKNAVKNLAWETIAVLFSVLLASESAINLSNDTLSSSVMLAGVGVLAFLTIYLQTNRLRIFSLNQLRKMKGSVDEELGMIRMQLAGIAARLSQEGAAVSLDQLHNNLKRLYHGLSPAQQLHVQRFERELRERFGVSIPLDELYKIVTRLERGLDPFEPDEK